MAGRDILGLHVVGEGIGECIILELPNAAPAVIDCGNPEVADYAINFIKKELGWDSVSFIAITHPHLDHFSGLGRILDAFANRCGGLWAFPGFFQGDSINRYLRWIELTNPNADFDATFFSDAVRREWILFSEFATRHKILPRVMRTDEPCMRGEVEILCLLPCGNVADAFDRDLSQCAPSKDWLDDFPNSPALELPDPPEANHASSVLSIVWGSTRLILCGDCELPSWNAWDAIGRKLSGDIHGLKIGHHGSSNGAFRGLVDCLNKKTHAVVTPFKRGKSPLPDPKTIEVYDAKCGSLRITAPSKSVAMRVEDAGAVLRAFGAAIDDPASTAAKLLKLHARLQQHENVVGILFDDKGNAVDQYWGKGTGRPAVSK